MNDVHTLTVTERARVIETARTAAGNDVTNRATVRRCVSRAVATAGVILPPHEWADLIRELTDEVWHQPVFGGASHTLSGYHVSYR